MYINVLFNTCVAVLLHVLCVVFTRCLYYGIETAVKLLNNVLYMLHVLVMREG